MTYTFISMSKINQSSIQGGEFLDTPIRKSRVNEFDSQIIVAAKTGDEKASRIIIKRFSPMLFKYFSNFTRQKSEIEDFSQETLLRVFKALPQFNLDGEAKFSTWILVIASNLRKNHHRNLMRRKKLEANNSLPLWFEQKLENAELSYSQKQATIKLQQHIYALKPELAEPFILFVEYELSYQEIAEVLNLKVGTVRVKISRARKKLQKILNKMEVSYE